MAYLLDDEARDVSRLTGIPWSWQRVHQRGPLHPMIDLLTLSWWEQFLVAWARIGAHYYLNQGAPDGDSRLGCAVASTMPTRSPRQETLKKGCCTETCQAL